VSYLDRVNACNALDLTGVRPLRVDGTQVGWVTADHAHVLARYDEVFAVSPTDVQFVSSLQTPEARSRAMARITPELAATGLYPKPRNELYAVKPVWSSPPLFTVDRALVAGLGVRAYGVHVNGFVRRGDGIHLWIGTRAMDREVEPGKLDNMVAGGQPAHLSLAENLVKECDEEAGLDPSVARTARPVGSLSYAFSSSNGIKADTLFCYDLEMPEGLVPKNKDGEISGYALMPLTQVLELVRDTTRFKFNVNLVILDFAIRHGGLDPDAEPDFERIVAGLHCRPDPS